MRRLAKRPAVALLVLALLLLVSHVAGQSAPKGSASAKVASSAAPKAAGSAKRAVRTAAKKKTPVAVMKAADIEGIEDPIALHLSGLYWRTKQKDALAKQCFEAAIARHEVNLYRKLAGTPYATALVQELMEDDDDAEATWRESFEKDLLTAYYFLSHYSQHPNRKALLADAKVRVEGWVEAVKRGQSPVIFVTKKGTKKRLKVPTPEEIEEAFEEGKPLRYAYIDKLDLSNKVWEKRVGCRRCVIGSVHAYGATFKDKVDFKGFVLGDFHLGKKWKGKVNKSAFINAATFDRLYAEHSVFFGKVDLDSVVIEGRVANFPFVTFEGETNLRNMRFGGTAEFRFSHFSKPASFKSSVFSGSAHFAHSYLSDFDLSRVLVENRPMHFASSRFTGSLLVEESTFAHGLTLENVRLEGDATFRRNTVDGQLNMSRIYTTGSLMFQRNEVKHMLFYGGIIKGAARFDDCVFDGAVRFSLDELTRREHLADATALHKRYKLYQGDDDADEDLTKKSQYGVRHVDDLVSRFHGDVSFANTYFSQFVSFERVNFGTKGKKNVANFYNTQFGGEAHFERANFFGIADFRTIAGEELSFNRARFYDRWMLDDANVPGRLTTTESILFEGATVSMAGADIQSFGIDHSQLLEDPERIWDTAGHRLFYERCLHAMHKGEGVDAYINDPRLSDAQWDASGEKRVTDAAQIAKRVETLCIERTIDEYTRLRDTFQARSKSEESDWAYWHLKHYINHRHGVSGGIGRKIVAKLEWVVFEKAFGWGVLLSNLLLTATLVILFFAFLMRVLCADMHVEWDGKPIRYRDLPIGAQMIVSIHSFIGGLGDAENLIPNSTKTWKYLYTAEILVGIIVITFFIGAYTRLVVSGGA